MPLTLHTLSGSPYAWRVQIALAHKGIPHALRPLSYDAGDVQKPELAALNPRRRVPVLEHDGFVLYESAAILEYIEDTWPEPRLLSPDPRRRAIERRLGRARPTNTSRRNSNTSWRPCSSRPPTAATPPPSPCCGRRCARNSRSGRS